MIESPTGQQSSRGPGRTPTAGVLVVLAALATVVIATVLGSIGGPAASTRPNDSSGQLPSVASHATIAPGATGASAGIRMCHAGDLAMSAGGWGGATGSLAGGATLINVSITPCRLRGRPALELLSRGQVIANGGAGPSARGHPVVLLPGGVARVTTVWTNWCGDPPELPLRLELVLPDDSGTLEGVVRPWQVVRAAVRSGPEQAPVPRCDAPGAGSAIGVPRPFTAPDPLEPDDPEAVGEPCTPTGLTAYFGPWGVAAGTSYANVVVFNGSGFDCDLARSPVLNLRDADGALLATAEHWPDPNATFRLSSGRAAITMIGFANWCGPAPELPFRFDLRIGDSNLAIATTSERSEIGVPGCNSPGGTPPPSLAYTGPFTIPGTSPPTE